MSSPSLQPEAASLSLDALLPSDVADDLRQVEAIIRASLDSDIELIRGVSGHILAGGGKRIRPIILLLAARANGAQVASEVRQLAAAIEIVHTTTLLHDDVVDASSMRRGRQTACRVFGNAASVLVGDYLYARVFQMVVDLDRMPVLKTLADTTSLIAAGEVAQLAHMGDAHLTERDYRRVIESKTAKLFETAARLGAMLADASPDVEACMADYGAALGVAFQVIDDWLDFSGNETAIGKNLGDDLAEGKVTLPLIYAMRLGTDAQRETIERALAARDRRGFERVLPIVLETGALDLTRQYAKESADQAVTKIACLNDSQYKKTLLQLPRFVVERAF